jgi:hypothetical protein
MKLFDERRISIVMTDRKPPRTNAVQKPGTKWTSLALPEELVEKIRKAAAEKGISAAGLARQILEGHFPPVR